MSYPPSLRQTDTWTTRDGRVLQISEMETNHIVATLKMLERNAASIGIRWANKLTADTWQIPPSGSWDVEGVVDSLIDEAWDTRDAAKADAAGWFAASPLARAFNSELEKRETTTTPVFEAASA
jgi:hypothetical protein